MSVKFEKGISVLEKILEEEKYRPLTRQVLEVDLYQAIFNQIQKYKEEEQTEATTINSIIAILDNFVSLEK
tara:strand:+ start:114 stop:326 length:213 start_codon:yes stop_codon:yes gene_type:complete